MTPVATIRADLVKLLHTASASAKISFDPMAPEEIEEAYIITRLEVRHGDRQLDMVYYRSAVVTLIAAAKTTADLDALVDALAVTDNQNEGTLRGGRAASGLPHRERAGDLAVQPGADTGGHAKHCRLRGLLSMGGLF